MRTGSSHLLLPALIAGLGLMPGAPTLAQTFTALHTFTAAAGANASNSDGANPSSGLLLSGGTLYGTAIYGGNSGWGTLFALDVNGTGFTTVYHFTGGIDGAIPFAGLALAQDTLYGTAQYGGTTGNGTVYSVKTNGSGFLNLHSFTAPANNSFGIYTNADGAHPYAGLILSDGTLYGAANNGGRSGQGTLFAIPANGGNFTTVHSFTSGSGGAYASAGLILTSNTLYGANYSSLGSGAVFAINTNASSFTNYYAFTGRHVSGNGVFTNADGANPHAELILSGTTLYGTTSAGGSSGNGTVFAMNVDGSGFTTLHTFTQGVYNPSGLFTNSDGANPFAGLILAGSNLYGTAQTGGTSGNGTVFMLNTNGTDFEVLYSFSATPPYPAPQTNSDGANPSGTLVLAGYNLYGTTPYGGTFGNGTVFRLSFAPQLTIVSSGSNVILSWPTHVAGFDYSGFRLQSATEIGGPFTNLQGATSPYTNPATAAQQFFRLSQ